MRIVFAGDLYDDGERLEKRLEDLLGDRTVIVYFRKESQTSGRPRAGLELAKDLPLDLLHEVQDFEKKLEAILVVAQDGAM